MQGKQRRTFAALLITASLVAPSAALAADPEPSPEAPAEGTSAQSAAKYQVTREEAIAIARKVMSIPASLGEPNVSMSESPDAAIWSLDFHSSGKEPGMIGISVAVDAETGAILNYSRYSSDPTQDPAPLTLTRSEAAGKAEQWLDVLAGDIKHSLQLVETSSVDYWGGPNAAYNFRWVRMVKGYPVRDGGVNISIDARTGDLTSFYSDRRTDAAYTVPDTLLDQEAAEAAYREQVKLGLRYAYFNKPGTDSGEWRLVYQPEIGFYPPMNQEGKILDNFLKPVEGEELPEMVVVPTPDQPYQKPATPLSREQALKLAQEASGQTGEPANAYYSEYGEAEKSRGWEFNWQLTDDEGQIQGNVNVRVDVDRGVVVNFHQWKNTEQAGDQDADRISREEAEQEAIEFIREYRADLAGQLVIMPNIDRILDWKISAVAPQVYYVRFLPMHDGIPVESQDVTVDVDAFSGEVRSFWTNEFRPKGEFPARDGVISPDEAMDSFLEQQGLELSWYQAWVQPSPEKEPERAEPALVWAPGITLEMQSIDAKTGAPLDYQGRDVVEAGKLPADIEGHPAQREIELLLGRGILTAEDGKFNPDVAVTAEEAAQWLVMSRGIMPYVAYDFRGNLSGMGGAGLALSLENSAAAPYFGAALQAGLMLPEDFAEGFEPDDAVSRELFALWAVRAMGYGAIVRMENEIEMPFSDQESIGAKYANAVALLHGLKVISGDEATAFEPQRALTRAEAAQILFHVSAQARYY